MRNFIKNLSFVVLMLLATGVNAQKKLKATAPANTPGTRWSIDKANAWYANYKWLNGADFITSNAINQLEMWQAATFDSTLNEKELGWAENIGFNTMRVYLHSMAWKQDKEGLKNRMNTFLTIADRHHIKILFVFFDDCWNKIPVGGLQPAPKPGIHNSGWVQDPGDPFSNDTTQYAALENYVKDVLGRFKNDKRILLWDLYNEPGNSGKGKTSLVLLTKIFGWAREINPDQPISAGLWNWNFNELNAFQALNSDVITYHDYDEPQLHQRVIDMLRSHGRPMICTEYMARARNSRFVNVLPMLKKENIGAINWGFVAGKSNTIFAWDTPLPNGEQPAEWFHDIFKKDGTPYREDEINLIKKLNDVK